MEFGKRFARAGALTATVAMAALVGTAQATPLPPKAAAAIPGCWPRPRRSRRPRCRRSSTAWRRPSSRRARPTGSTTSCGSSRTSTPTATASRTASTSTSRARRRPTTDGLKVPVIYEDSPYYAGGARRRQLGRRPRARRAAGRARPRAPYFDRAQHQPDDQHDLRVHLAAARLRRRALRVARHRQLRRLPDLRRAERDARRRPRSSTGSTAARKGYTTRAGTTEVAPVNWHNGNIGDDGHVLQRHDPDRRGHRPASSGLEAIVPISAISDWYDYYRANGMVRAPHSAPAARAQRLPGRGPRRARRVRLLAQRRGHPPAHDLLAG